MTAASGSAGSRVAQGLRDRLRTGALAPGTVLSQAEIAAEYGVSRIPVRDALHILSTEGLVDLGVSGAVVTGLSIAELQELYELREAIEPVVTAIAVPNVGRAEIAADGGPRSSRWRPRASARRSGWRPTRASTR